MKKTETIYTDKENEGNNLVELIQLLQSIDINSSEAKLNTTSMSDNNGGRILF